MKRLLSILIAFFSLAVSPAMARGSVQKQSVQKTFTVKQQSLNALTFINDIAETVTISHGDETIKILPGESSTIGVAKHLQKSPEKPVVESLQLHILGKTHPYSINYSPRIYVAGYFYTCDWRKEEICISSLLNR